MRINIIHPKHLADQHLVAEYREIKMSTYYYRKSSMTKTGIDKNRISERYTLSTGHAYMWYDKFGFIKKRFQLILKEMKKRGFKSDFNEIDFTGIPVSAFGDFIPTKDDIEINVSRILLRIYDKPDWYKFKGEKVSNWYSFYFDLFGKV